MENTNFDAIEEKLRTGNGISEELRRDLVTAIRSLPNKRDSFALYAYTYEDKSVEEISKVINTTPKYVYEILNNARKELALSVLD
jgi:DNA-directed RNA polymerase specialized sigma24 family protein